MGLTAGRRCDKSVAGVWREGLEVSHRAGLWV